MKLFIKRFFPFLLTFGAGLLVASFFVTVSAPKFNFGKRYEGRHKNRFYKNESERLKRENERLKRELAEKDAINSSDEIMLLEVPPPPMPPMPPAPPKPPVAPRN